MKRQYYPDKPHSWLQFPVSLEGIEVPNLHITLKFFGDARIDPYAVESRVGLNPHLALHPADFDWEPKFWGSPFDGRNYFVLAFTKIPTVLKVMHNIFAIIKDPYTPWIPHITVPKNYFHMVEDQGLSPVECELEFGELELCLGREK